MPADAAPLTRESTPDQSGAAPSSAWTAPQGIGMRTLSTPPRFSRWNCSAVGAACGTTPQKLAGSASAAAANAASHPARPRTRRHQAPDFPPDSPLHRRHRASSPSARPGCARPRRWRRCLIITAPIEIAARAAIAIRIGTSGEEEPLPEVDGLMGGPPPLEPAALPFDPLPWLPWPDPPLPAPPGLPPPGALGAEELPFDFQTTTTFAGRCRPSPARRAGGAGRLGLGVALPGRAAPTVPPVTDCGAFSYCTPDESSA